MMKETKYQKFVVNVTDSLYRDIRIVAGYKNVSMSKWAFDLLQAEVNKALAKPDKTTPALESQALIDELVEALWGIVTSFHAVEYMEDHMKQSSAKARAAIEKVRGKP